MAFITPSIPRQADMSTSTFCARTDDEQTDMKPIRATIRRILITRFPFNGIQAMGFTIRTRVKGSVEPRWQSKTREATRKPLAA